MLMTAAEYRDSLRAYKPRVFVNGKAIESVADEPLLAPGHRRCRRDLRLRASAAAPAADDGAPGRRRARPSTACCTSTRRPTDLLYKLEAVRLVCRDVRLRAALSRRTTR